MNISTPAAHRDTQQTNKKIIWFVLFAHARVLPKPNTKNVICEYRY